MRRTGRNRDLRFLWALALLLAPPGWAVVGSTTDFREQREAASRAVARAQNREKESRVAMRLALDDHPLTADQEWSVSAELPRVQIANKTGSPQSRSSVVTRVFHFKVLSTEGGLARLAVTSEGLPTMSLVLDRRYHVRELRGAGFGLDLFPLAVPAAKESTLVEDAASVSFTGEDAFGREVAVTWNKGDPWPAVMSGPAGKSRLLKAGAQ